MNNVACCHASQAVTNVLEWTKFEVHYPYFTGALLPNDRFCAGYDRNTNGADKNFYVDAQSLFFVQSV